MLALRAFALTLLVLALLVLPEPGGRAQAEGGYSVRCLIPGGAICIVPASPLGSPCWCPGDVQGVVVP